MKTSSAKVTAVLVTLFAALMLYAQRSVQYDPSTYVLNLPTNILGFWFGNQYLTNLVGTGLTNDNGNLEATGSGAGTVTSVAASTTISGLSWSGSPITTSGTLALSGTVGASSIDAAIARLASPVFTGDPTGPTPAANDNDTSLATTAYVQAEETALLAANYWQATNANLTTVANLTGGTTTNFLAGDGTFKQVVTNMIPSLNAMLTALQPLDTDLTTVANLTGGTSTNFFAGDGSFKQVTTNMVPGLNGMLTSLQPLDADLTRIAAASQTIRTWDAQQFMPITNATAAALPTVRGNGIGAWHFSGSASTAVGALLIGTVPATADLTSGATLTLSWFPTQTGSTNVFRASIMSMNETDIDTDSYGTAITITNTQASTAAGTIVQSSITIPGANIDGLTNVIPGNVFSILVERDPTSGSDTDTSNVGVLAAELRAP